MNGQPPPAPVPPPPPSPAPVPPLQVVRPSESMGCFAKGCLLVLILGFLFIAGVIGSTWYLCRKAADVFTSTESVDLHVVPPDRAQVNAAERSVARVKTAIATGQETTVGFTAADLNALLDRDPDFEDIRGRTRIDIADSIMTVAISAPLDEIRWKRLRERWFNASATFTFDYTSGMFHVEITNLEANGHQISEAFLSTFVSVFNEAFNSRFHDEVRKNGSSEFWDHVKSITLEDDKVVVTTKVD